MWPFDHTFATYRWPFLFGYFARGNANLGAGFLQTALYALIGALIWPPSRRAIHRFVDAKLSPIHAHITRQAEHRKWEARTLAKMHLHLTGTPADAHPEHGRLT